MTRRGEKKQNNSSGEQDAPVQHEREQFRFMTDEEMEDYKKRRIYGGKIPDKEMIISDRISIPITRNARNNANILVIGNTREAIRAFVIPNILSASASSVIVDPDGEM